MRLRLLLSALACLASILLLVLSTSAIVGDFSGYSQVFSAIMLGLLLAQALLSYDICLSGVMQALRMRLQSFGIATQLTQMLPYLAALIGIKLTGMRMRAPAANGTPYPHPLSAPCLRRKSAGESQSKGSKA